MGRKYSILVDQSGKVEQYNTGTAIAYSCPNNDFPARCIKISKRHKKMIKTDGKKMLGSSKKLHLKMFSAGIYMLTKPHIDEIKEILIDEEYEGNDELIKGYLTNFYQDFSDMGVNDIPDLKTDLVHNYSGGNPECHELGNKVRANKVDPHFEPNLGYLKNLILPSR